MYLAFQKLWKCGRLPKYEPAEFLSRKTGCGYSERDCERASIRSSANRPINLHVCQLSWFPVYFTFLYICMRLPGTFFRQLPVYHLPLFLCYAKCYIIILVGVCTVLPSNPCQDVAMKPGWEKLHSTIRRHTSRRNSTLQSVVTWVRETPLYKSVVTYQYQLVDKSAMSLEGQLHSNLIFRFINSFK